MISGDMNARFGDSEVEGGLGKFGVSGVNENGRKLIDVYGKETECGNTFF